MKMQFYILDVFTQKKYAGNQLAVFRNAAALTDGEMQKIAHEMNFSETTFILSDRQSKGGYNVRIFTPRAELPFAGHPTLGTAYVIQREIIQKPVAGVALNLKVGQIPVTFTYHWKEPGVLWMKQKEPVFGRQFPAAMTAKAIGVATAAIHARYPIQDVSTGMYSIIVPLKTLASLQKARINMSAYGRLIAKAKAVGVLIFAPETCSSENDLHVRFFAPLYGIAEDPATGSANGCLAGYLVEHRYFHHDKIDIRVEQGYEIDRPSLLYLRAKKIKNRISIHVGGRVKMVARGEFV